MTLNREVISKEKSEAKTLIIRDSNGNENKIDKFIGMVLEDINYDTSELKCGLIVNGLGTKESKILFDAASKQFMENYREELKNREEQKKKAKKDLKELAQNLIDYLEEKEKREEQKDL